MLGVCNIRRFKFQKRNCSIKRGFTGGGEVMGQYCFDKWLIFEYIIWLGLDIQWSLDVKFQGLDDNKHNLSLLILKFEKWSIL